MPAAMPGNCGLARQAGVLTAAALVPLAIWTVAVPLLGVHLHAVTGDEPGAVQTIGPVMVLATAAGAALAGWALLAALKRITRRALPIWTVVALATLLVSMPGPFLGAANTAASAVLALMHVGVAAVLVPGLRRTAGAARRATPASAQAAVPAP